MEKVVVDNYLEIVIMIMRSGALHWCGARGCYGSPSAA